jgi:ataxia telangiectasia mutated family protein
LLLEIFRNIDEPDSFYGVQQPASLLSIMDRLDYEKDGLKSLSFRGAYYDSQLQRANQQSELSPAGLIRALDRLDLSGLTFSLLERQRAGKAAAEIAENMYRSARRLGQWDLPATTFHKSEEAVIYRTLQSLHNASDRVGFSEKLNSEILRIMSHVVEDNQTAQSVQSSWRTLAIMTEIDEMISAQGIDELQDTWKRLLLRNEWMQFGRYWHTPCSPMRLCVLLGRYTNSFTI